MNEERLERIRRLHAEALELDSSERDAYLVEACGEDVDLRREVDSLLEARERMGEFLARPAAAVLGEAGRCGSSFGKGDRIGSYEIVETLGSGGGGTVYGALQERPRRQVALKVMRSSLASETARRRFEEEAEILARLDHPDVATVYEAGVHDDDGTVLPWFAMEFVEGARSVLEFAEAESLGVRRRLGLVARICDAIHHGHQKGIIHRDIKPGNLLVDGSGRLRIIDFGIARVVGSDASREREVVGTLAYMSPEQCVVGGDGVDVRSDVYALGVVLYELLTGKLPHDVEGLPITEAMRRIQETSPTPLEDRDRSLRGDVAAIVGKALRKNPDGRYASAAALAEDIRRHLTHQPVKARPAGPLYLLGKFARRRRVAFFSLAAILMVSVLGTAVSVRLAAEREQERREAEFQAYVANVAAAAAALRVNDVADARQCLDRAPKSLRNWEWYHLEGRLDSSVCTIMWPESIVSTGAVSPDGALAAALRSKGSAGYELRVWNVRDGETIYTHDFPRLNTPPALAFGSGHEPLAVGKRDGTVEFRDAWTGEVESVLEAHEDQVLALAFDAAGNRLATGARDGSLKIWCPETGLLQRALQGHEDRVIDVAFDPAGRRLASGGREGTIRIWDVETGDLLASLAGHGGSVEGVAWSPDGSRLASCSRDETVRLWDVSTVSEAWRGYGHVGNIRDVAFRPDGRTIATASYDRTVRLWDVGTGEEKALLHGHVGRVKVVAFLPDGSRLASFCDGGNVKFWEVDGAEEIPSLRGHEDRVLSLDISPEGDQLLSCSRDGSVRLWDLETRSEIDLQHRYDGRCVWTAFLEGGTCAASVGMPARLVVRRLPHGEVVLDRRVTSIYGIAPAHRSRRLFIGDSSGTVHEIDLETGAEAGSWPFHDGRVSALVLDDEETLIATASLDGAVRVGRLADMGETASARVRDAHARELAFGPGGRLAAALTDGTIRIFESRSLEALAELEGHTGPVNSVAFSPDGTRIVSGGQDDTVRLWDVERACQVAVLHGHRHPVISVRFSRDGRLIASGGGFWEGKDSVIKLWEAPRK